MVVVLGWLRLGPFPWLGRTLRRRRHDRGNARDAVGKRVHRLEERILQPRRDTTTGRDDLRTERVGEPTGATTVPGRGGRRDRRCLRGPRMRQHGRQAAPGSSRRRRARAAGSHEQEEQKRRKGPHHSPLMPRIRSIRASQSWSRIVKVLLMPMLHGCAFPGCSTFTLSTYCVEHELLVRAQKEAERALAADHALAADAALTADAALAATATDTAA